MDAPEIYGWEEDDLEDMAVTPEWMEQWDAAQQEEQAAERNRYDCPKCARARDAAARRDIEYGGPDPGLDTRAHPVTLAADESAADVHDRDDDTELLNFDADDFVELQRTGEYEGVYLRDVYCDDHDTASITYVGPGNGKIRNGVLRPILYV